MKMNYAVFLSLFLFLHTSSVVEEEMIDLYYERAEIEEFTKR